MPPRSAATHAPNISRPHTLSLKVLRLSKPSLTPSSVLPAVEGHPALQTASLSYPTQRADDVFPLAPLLTLPPLFGAAYVDETFSCTLCVNNELPQSSKSGGESPDGGIQIRDLSVQAELQTPSSSAAAAQGVDLDIKHDKEQDVEEAHGSLRPGKSWQGIVRHELKEEGPHVLAITVGYTEVHGGDGETEHRKRQFRKLYQFAAQQAVGVRTKIGELRGAPLPPTTTTTTGHEQPVKQSRKFAVEAQIENLTDQSVLLDRVSLELGKALSSTGLNGDEESKILLAPGDIEQIAFKLDQVGDGEDGELRTEAGRFVLAQLKVDWRMGMGQEGTLKTGWLGCLRRN